MIISSSETIYVVAAAVVAQAVRHFLRPFRWPLRPNFSFLTCQLSNSGGRQKIQSKAEDGVNFGGIIYQQTGLALTDQVAGTVKELNRKNISNGKLTKDKSDRATTEQVLDPRTRMILYKLLNKGVIQEIHGCVSTGKEANVYHAILDTGEEVAVKIYKTSILVFKDRDKCALFPLSSFLAVFVFLTLPQICYGRVPLPQRLLQVESS